MEEQKRFSIGENSLNAMLNRLAQLPYAEVAGIISEAQKDIVLLEPEKAGEDEKK